ncbi:MAG: type II toxin-antitoxin system HicA family toxin [Dehalococcoidia bacterium]|nr:type II toxin-antitoxin system HicA family toxin [Dehalococcoidia bacterium]
MSPRLPRITATQLVRALHRAGWDDHHQTGSHLFLRHPSRPGTVVVPVHARKIIKPKVLQSILDQAGLGADELKDRL